jgi:hypothetical protein
MNAQDLAQALACDQPGCKCGKKAGEGYLTHCPAHADNNPSLSLSDFNGKTLYKCLAGCSQTAVSEALKNRGLSLSDNGGKPRFSVDKAYDYQDSTGKLVFQVCRLTPKDFRQRRPDGAGGWIWNLKGVDRIPYRLPELIKADTVYIVEGEKDADNLVALSLCATCNPGGAGKWRREFNQLFRGKRVIILPDNDEVGQTHSLNVAQKLHGIATSVKIVELPGLPEKGDVSDWLQGGGTAEQLQALADVASEFAPGTTLPPAKNQDGKEKCPPQAGGLLDLSAGAELFHTPDHDGFAVIPVNGHLETWPIRSRMFRNWLLRRFYDAQGKPPGTQAFQEALGVLTAQAQFDGPENPVSIRVGEHDGNIFVDLGNDAWQSVEITPTGWRVTSDPPLRFRRSRGMLALPHPIAGGSIDELRPFINISSDDDWKLLVSWLVAALKAKGPYPMIIFQGEQGSAKSTHARVLRNLIDPSTAPLRAEPRDGRDLMIAANNSWVLSYDNLSGIKPWLADAFCRLSTGGGYSTRELYTDGDEALFDAQRPIILNGIDAIVARADMLERSLILQLPQIGDDNRRTEREFWRSFNQIRPRILGALFDAVSAAIRNFDHVDLPKKPRMADFAQWATAAETAFGWQQGAFLEAYAGNRNEVIETSLDASPVAVAVRALMSQQDQWSGTPTELHEALGNHVSEATRKSRVWPKAANALTNMLRRFTPFLRAVGIMVDFARGQKRQTTISKSGEKTVDIDDIVEPLDSRGHEPRRSADESPSIDGIDARPSRPEPALHADLDGDDGVDDEMQPFSESTAVRCDDCRGFTHGPAGGDGVCQPRLKAWNGKLFQSPDSLHPCPNFEAQDVEGAENRQAPESFTPTGKGTAPSTAEANAPLGVNI